MRARSLLKQWAAAIVAAASLVSWTLPPTHFRPVDEELFQRPPGDLVPNGLNSASASSTGDYAQEARVRNAYNSLPLLFEINHGQADSRVRFISRGNGYALFITPTEALLASSRTSHPDTNAATSPLMHMKLIGANPRASTVGLGALSSTTNYVIGNDPAKWRTNVPTYAKVKCQNVYPGVDLVYYGAGTQLEYDFIVSPGASYQDIKIHFEGADKATLNDAGDLVIGTAIGEVCHHKPVVYQENNGSRQIIDARYALKSNDEIAFEIGAYDADRPLIIDPVLSYATYFGSVTGSDSIRGVAFDSDGDAYVVGTSFSSDLPTTPGALQSTARSNDAFIAKLNSSGTGVIYVTYLGGNGGESGDSIAVDQKGRAYVAGVTFSSDFPTTMHAFQSQPPAGITHRFVAKLNSTGTALVYSTYLGSPNEFVETVSIAVDGEGQATVAGYTDSELFPTTPGALQPRLSGNTDVFIARLNSLGSGLVFLTYIGGKGYDTTYSLALDAAGNSYVAGRTSSADFPTTRGAYKREITGSSASFVVKLNGTGDRLVYSTFLGGDIQVVTGIAVDSNGNAYVTGNALFSDLPTTPGSFQPLPAGGFDTYVMKLNNTGSELVYATFLGGSGWDQGSAIAVDSLGQAHVTGRTTSSDFPLASPLQPRKHGGPLFKSIDGGASWDDVPALAFEINSLVIDPQVTSNLYASTSADIIKSTDGGATWSVIAPRLSGSLVIDPVRPAILYLATSLTIHKSTDAGATWQPTGLSIDFPAFIRTLVIDPKRPDILYFGGQPLVAAPTGTAASVGSLEEPPVNVLFKTTDGGTSWLPIDFGRPVRGVNYLAIDPQNTSTIYAGADADGLFKSTDDGASWFKPNASIFVTQLVINPINTSILYATGFTGVLKSTNGGGSWGQTALQRPGRASLAIDPQTPSTLYAANPDGLFKTTDGGASWQLSLERVFINSIHIDPKNPSIIYTPTNATSDVFVTKLNAAGTALVYSTFLGGFVEDSASSIAVDPYGNAYVGGVTYSGNFPVTSNAYRSRSGPFSTGFVLRIADPTSPRVTNATITGKKLLIAGEGFDRGAVIRVKDTDLQTQNDETTPGMLLISKRGGKQIARGQTVSIRVRNADGRLSDVFVFTRSID